MRDVTVRRFAFVVAVALAVAIAAAAVVWLCLFSDSSWSFHVDKDAEITSYSWLRQALIAAAVTMAALLAIGRRRESRDRFAAIAISATSAAGIAMMYVPWSAFTQRGVDRLRGSYEAPVPGMRTLLHVAVITLVAAVIFIAMTQLLRAPAQARMVATIVGAAVCTITVSLFWLLCFLPATRLWLAADALSGEALIAFKPCRGATLYTPRGIGAGRIDDLWLHFGTARTPAISYENELRREYGWLSLKEAFAFRVHRLDPHVVHCDSRWRSELVAALPWHRVGRDQW